MGIGATLGSLAWASSGIYDYNNLPEASPVAGPTENRQDTFTQITLPLVSLAASSLLTSTAFLAGIDGEERQATSPRLGGRQRTKPCTNQNVTVQIEVEAAFLGTALSTEKVEPECQCATTMWLTQLSRA